jgi:Peptidase family M1 domain
MAGCKSSRAYAVLFCAALNLMAVSGAAASPALLPPELKSAQALYLKLGSVGLDKARVYHIRDAALDRAAIHISLDDGTIAFTEDVAGRITGAFFAGDGEVLLAPPSRTERASMALFTGAAILEERFGTAYFRFNDDTAVELQPFLRATDNADAFVEQWDPAARAMASIDALRLFMSFSRLLPPDSSRKTESAGVNQDDRLLHARLDGDRLGGFDVYYDSTTFEQVWAGQVKGSEDRVYYDMWTSFSADKSQAQAEAVNTINGEVGKSDPIDIYNYTIHTEIKPPTEVSSTAVLDIGVHDGGPRTLLFELSRFLKVESAEADGHPVEFIHNPSVEGTQLAVRGNDIVAVVFPETLKSGQKLQLRFVYSGDVLSEAGDGLLYVGARGTWYPNRGFAEAHYDLTFTYPRDWTLIATGKRMAGGQAETVDGDSALLQSRWVSERPIPVAGFNLGKYAQASVRAGNIAVETYATAGVEKTFPQAAVPPPLPPASARTPGIPGYIAVPPSLPPSPARSVQAVADEAAHAVNYFSRCFGPYPYESLRITQVPGFMNQGWPGMIYLTTFAFLSNTDAAALHMDEVQRTLNRNVVVHETAHQWWGDLVGWGSYRDQWMIEALANYSSMMLLRSENAGQFHAAMASYRDDLLEKQKNGRPLMDAGPVTFGVRLSSSQFPYGYEPISYGRGTWLLHMLHEMMVDTASKDSAQKPGAADEPDLFVAVLLKLREQYEGKRLTTRDMIHAFEEALPRSLWYEGHRSLDWFYDGWVNGTAVPKFELSSIKITGAGSARRVAGVIRQEDAPDDLVTSIPVYAVVEGKNSLLGRVFADGPETRFDLRAPAGTRKVVLDPYETVLRRER